MATFTSVTSGNWNNGATWGNASPGVKGTDWPGNATDIVNIGTTAGQSHVVTYNVSETNALGQVTIGATSGVGVSRLEFSAGMNTKLTLGHQDILVQLSGELRVGAPGAIIPKQYLAELVWNTTADNAKGLNLALGGKCNIYGDPDYYGSDFDTTLVSQAVIPAAGNSVTITVLGDFTTKWAAGHELLVHKGGAWATNGHYLDFCRLAITSVTANGGNTDIACTVTERQAGALTCLTGADVLHLSRNVLLYKLGYNANLNQNNTLRPRMVNSNALPSTNVNINDAGFGGWNTSITGPSFSSNGVVMRNGNFGLTSQRGSITNAIIAIMSTGASTIYNSNIISCTIAACVGSAIAIATQTTLATNCKCFGNGGVALSSFAGKAVNCYLYSNSSGVGGGSIAGRLRNCSIGYNPAGAALANLSDFNYQFTQLVYLENCILQATPSKTFHNGTLYMGRFCSEHHNQVVGDHRVFDAFGDIYKTPADGAGDNPTQRSGGAADVCEVVPLSGCDTTLYLEILNVRVWATAGVSKTYRFYVQTDFATLPTAKLKLYGEYLSAGAGGALTTVASTQNITTRANAGDWSQYAEVTINPVQTGHVNLYLRLMGFEAGPKKVWVDPMMAITGGAAVTVTPYWSYGEVQLDIDPVAVGGGVFPIIGGSHIIQPARAA